jgi:translation initiation factor IF-1
MKDDVLKRLGTVTKVHGGTYEVVDDETGMKILCTLNGKMRMHSIRLIIGDKVDVEVSAYDLTKGRVVYRHR